MNTRNIIFIADAEYKSYVPELQSHLQSRNTDITFIVRYIDISAYTDELLGNANNIGVAIVFTSKHIDRQVDVCSSLKRCGIQMILVNALRGPFTPNTKKASMNMEKLARDNSARLADIPMYWRQKYGTKKIPALSGQLTDEQKAVLTQALTPLIERTQMLVLWQFNGRYANCNYTCPYCYVATSVNKGMHFNYEIEKWEESFSRHFENTNTVFYLSYGEPMTASKFYDVVDMVGRHPKWEVKVTSNISVKLDRLLNTQVAKEHRLNINASFHPTQIDIDSFIDKLDQIRAAGIEPSIVYVMYPPQIDDLERYMPIFRAKGYRVHIRAFRGLHRGKKYPGAYTRDEWNKTAKYMDRGNLKYQLCEINGLGRLSMLGVTHILVDNYGKVEMCDSYVGDRRYGNIFDDKLTLDAGPQPFPGLVPLAAVDDIADYVEADYQDLIGNNINSYITQGDVTISEDGTIHYPYENVDFNNELLRKELTAVPKPFTPKYKFWFNPYWFIVHFIYSWVIKKYGKWGFAWINQNLLFIVRQESKTPAMRRFLR